MHQPPRSAPAPSGSELAALRPPAAVLATHRQALVLAAPALRPLPNTKRTPNPLPSISRFGSWHYSSLPKRKKSLFSLGSEPRLGAYLSGQSKEAGRSPTRLATTLLSPIGDGTTNKPTAWP